MSKMKRLSLLLIVMAMVLVACGEKTIDEPKLPKENAKPVEKIIIKTEGSIHKDNVNIVFPNTDETDEPKEIPSDNIPVVSNSFNKDKPFDHLKKNDYQAPNKEKLISELPEQLQESITKYPETTNEILQYHELKDNPESFDLTGVYQKGDIPQFIQWDSRWGFHKISNSYMAHSGCGPTVLSSAYIHFTGDNSMNPAVMGDWANEQGYFGDSYGSSWDLFQKGAIDLGLTCSEIGVDLNMIQASIDSGALLVFNVTAGDFTTGGHYIMVTGYEDDMLKVLDVNSPINSQKMWKYERVLPQIRGAWELNI